MFQFSPKYIVLILSCLFPFSSSSLFCQSEPSYVYQSELISQEVQEIIQPLTKNNVIEKSNFRKNGEAEYFHAFEKLLKIATEEELKELTNHPAPVVRGYAFWGLYKKGYSDLRSLYKKHYKDTTEMIVANGCFVERLPLNAYIYEIVYALPRDDE